VAGCKTTDPMELCISVPLMTGCHPGSGFHSTYYRNVLSYLCCHHATHYIWLRLVMSTLLNFIEEALCQQELANNKSGKYIRVGSQIDSMCSFWL